MAPRSVSHSSRSHSKSPPSRRRMTVSRSRSPARRRMSQSRSPARRTSNDRGSRRYSRSPVASRGRRPMSNRDNPEPCTCIGVFGLSIETTERELVKLFEKFGAIQSVQVVIDAKTGRSRGFAFVYFQELECAKAAKRDCRDLRIDGRPIRVDYSITRRAHTPTPGIYMGCPTGRNERRYGGGGGGRSSGYRDSYRSSSPRYKRSRRRSPRDDYYNRGSYDYGYDRHYERSYDRGGSSRYERSRSRTPERRSRYEYDR